MIISNTNIKDIKVIKEDVNKSNEVKINVNKNVNKEKKIEEFNNYNNESKFINTKDSKTSDEFLDIESYIKTEEQNNKFFFENLNKRQFYFCLFLIIFCILSLIIGLTLLNINLNASITLIFFGIILFIPTIIFMKKIISSGYKTKIED